MWVGAHEPPLFLLSRYEVILEFPEFYNLHYSQYVKSKSVFPGSNSSCFGSRVPDDHGQCHLLTLNDDFWASWGLGGGRLVWGHLSISPRALGSPPLGDYFESVWSVMSLAQPSFACRDSKHTQPCHYVLVAQVLFATPSLHLSLVHTSQHGCFSLQ